MEDVFGSFLSAIIPLEGKERTLITLYIIHTAIYHLYSQHSMKPPRQNYSFDLSLPFKTTQAFLF